MAVTGKMFGYLPYELAAKHVDLANDTIKVALFVAALTLTQGTDHYFDAAPFTSNQVANGNGYTTGGAAVANKALTYDSGTRTTKFTHDAVTWAASTITARHAVHYDDTPAANKPVLCYNSSDADISSSNGNWVFTPNASGVLTLQAS